MRTEENEGNEAGLRTFAKAVEKRRACSIRIFVTVSLMKEQRNEEPRMARNFADEIQADHKMRSTRSIRAHPRNQRFSLGPLHSAK